MPQMVLELLTSWGDLFGCGPVKKVWRLVPLCLMWCLWCERNAWFFEDVETSILELRKLLLNMLYLWRAAHHRLSAFTCADLLN
jgi:hypothetical protein